MNPTVELVLKHKKANMRKSEFLMLEALKSAPHLCEDIPTWISLSGDLALSHQDGIYGFKFPKRFSELSQEKTSLYSPLLALFTLLTLII